MITKIKRSLTNYIKIMRVLKMSKKDIELIEILLSVIERNQKIIEDSITTEINKKEHENNNIIHENNLKDTNTEIHKCVELARKLDNVILNRNDEKYLQTFLSKNEMVEQFIGKNEKESYQILNKYDHTDFTFIELQFIYLYVLNVEEAPKYDNKLGMFKDLIAMIYQRIYMDSFRVEE